MNRNHEQGSGTREGASSHVEGEWHSHLSEVLEQRLSATVREMEERNRRLLMQSRQAVMGETISNVAHHWRQPLNLLGLLVQDLRIMVRKPQQHRPQMEERLAKMMEILERMSMTIDEFRFFFSPTGIKERFSVREVVQKALSLLDRAFLSHDIEMELEAPDDLEVYGYRNDFTQVILNILINAKDAFLARNTPRRRAIMVRVERMQERGVVTVTDNAGGIPEEMIDKVFEPYFTTKDRGHGVGIGLYMAKMIIENNMGGTLSVRNVEGGAEFRIDI